MIQTMSQDWTNRYEYCTLLWHSGIEIVLYLKKGIIVASMHGRSQEATV